MNKYTKQRIYKGETRQVYNSETDKWEVFYSLSMEEQVSCRKLPMETKTTELPRDQGEPFVYKEVD